MTPPPYTSAIGNFFGTDEEAERNLAYCVERACGGAAWFDSLSALVPNTGVNRRCAPICHLPYHVSRIMMHANAISRLAVATLVVDDGWTYRHVAERFQCSSGRQEMGGHVTEVALPTKRAGFWGVLAQRDFRLLWMGDAVSGLGNGITTVVLPLIALLTLSASPFQIGLLASAVWLPWLIVGLPAGAWIDRLPRRPIMIVCHAASASLFTSVSIAWWLDVTTYGHLLVVALLTGTATVFFQTAYHSYLPTILSKGDLVEGNAKLQGAEAATRVVGPALGGLVIAVFGAAVGLFADALTFVFCLVCMLLIRTREQAKPQSEYEESLRRQIAIGLRFVARDPYLRPIIIYGTLLNLGLSGYTTIQIIFLVQAVGVSTSVVGGLVAVAGLGGILGSIIARPLGRRFGTARSVVVLQLVTGPFILLTPLTTPGVGLLLFCVGGMVVIAGVVSCNVVLGSFRQNYCPPKLLGRVVASSMFVLHSTIPFGALLAGFLGDVVGLGATMWIMALLIAPCGLVLLLSPMRKERDLPVDSCAEPLWASATDSPSN
ncbi:MFS transporter [Rhodococcus marinonascens]|uniref:MFS transporter n=1 Tax=Rhodococcus marinonascens TaxID=38311 RepID=UPI000A6AD245|nr:MFS transporter [Rhodococcus marinonascens]